MTKFHRLLRCLLLMLLACTSVGCYSLNLTLRPPCPPIPSGLDYKAGVAKIDITPMPGFPMGGHSVAGKTARGYWTRLYARVIYLEDKSGQRLAMVSCDLWAMPAGLADRVADILSDDPACRFIGRDRLLIAATHNHHGPASFSSSSFYNAFAGPVSGFDPALFEFLAQRIASGISQAVHNSKQAQVYYSQTRMKLVARNRSYPAFKLNDDSVQILAENADLPIGNTSSIFPDPEAFAAIDPRVDVLTIKHPDQSVMGIMAVLATHPTTISHHSMAYNGELFGATSILAEQSLEHDGVASPIVAIFNGAEGDVSPYWTHPGRAATLSVGHKLCDTILAASKSATERVDQSIDGRFKMEPLANSTAFTSNGQEVQTDRIPIPGVATVGGANDAPTGYRDWGWRPGVTGKETPLQGDKLGALDIRWLPIPITKWVVSMYSYPTVVPLGVYRLGPLVIATLPGEFTTDAGRFIRSGLASNFDGHPPVILVGLANEYVSYFAARKEYAAQYYEGASTLYGPASVEVMLRDLNDVARELRRKPVPERKRDVSYSMGTTSYFGIRNVGVGAASRTGLEEVLQDASGKPIKKPPTLAWDDVMPSDHFGPTDMLIPVVTVEKRKPDGSWQKIDGDDGLDFVTSVDAAFNGRSRWQARWLVPQTASPAETYRFAIKKLDNSVVHSNPFQLSSYSFPISLEKTP